MAHNSPFSDQVFDEWDRLVRMGWDCLDDRQPPVEQVERWQGLFHSTHDEKGWLVSRPDAWLVSSLGITIALQQRRYGDAATLAEQYFAHPDSSLRDDEWWSMRVRLGVAIWLSGDIDGGLKILRGVLEEESLPAAQRSKLLRNDVAQALSDSDFNAQLAPFIAEVITLTHNQLGLRAASARTNAALRGALLAS